MKVVPLIINNDISIISISNEAASQRAEIKMVL